MADDVNFNLDGLEKFLEGIEKLKTIGEQFASSMETAPKGRSKAAQEMRAEQMKLLQSFTQIFKRTAKTYKLHDTQQESLLKNDIASRKRHARILDIALKKEEAETKLRSKREEQLFRKQKLREDTTERLRSQRRKLKFDIGAREQRFAQTASQYEAMSEMHYQRRATSASQRLEEQEARLTRAKQYETEVAEEAMIRRRRERQEKRSEKAWDNLQKFAIATTKTIFLAPFKMVGTALSALWATTKSVLSNTASMLRKGVSAAGDLISNVSDMTFGARAAGLPAFGTEYLGAAFKGVFDAPALVQRMTALRANPLDIAYPMMYGPGSRVGASPNESPAVAMAKLAEYAYGESKKYGANIGLRRSIDPLLQQFSTEELLAMQRTPENEFKRRTAEAKTNFGISDKTLQSMSNFDWELSKLTIKIKAYFATKLEPALEPLQRLGIAFVGLFDNILNEDKINKAVNYLINNLEKFTSWLKEDETKKEFERIWNGITDTLSAAWNELAKIDWAKIVSDIKGFGDTVNSFVNQFGPTKENEEAWWKTLPPGEREAHEKRMSARSVSKGAEIAERLSRDLGLTQEQAAGIVGNLYHESAGFRELQEINPKSGRGGYGWAQWTGPRREEYEAFAKRMGLSPSSDEANYLFLIEDLRSKYKDTLDAIKKTKTIAGAEHAFLKGYEGTPEATAAEEKRLLDSIAILNKMQNPNKDVSIPEIKEKTSDSFIMPTVGMNKINDIVQYRGKLKDNFVEKEEQIPRYNSPMSVSGYNMPRPVSVNLSIQDRQSSSSLGVQMDKVAGAVGGSFAFNNQFSSLQ